MIAPASSGTFSWKAAELLISSKAASIFRRFNRRGFIAAIQLDHQVVERCFGAKLNPVVKWLSISQQECINFFTKEKKEKLLLVQQQLQLSQDLMNVLFMGHKML